MEKNEPIEMSVMKISKMMPFNILFVPDFMHKF
jgi:hypothetical protein